MKHIVIHERWKCIACGACAAVAPDDWEIMPDTFSSIKKPHKTVEKSEGKQEERIIENEEELKTHKEAAEVCPVQCIHIYDVD